MHARWETLVDRLPFTRLMLDDPQVYSEEQLRRSTGSLLTHEGRAGAAPASAFSSARGCTGPGSAGGE